MVDTRGRGLSAPSDDHRPERLRDDVVSFVQSLDGRAGIVEWGSDLWGPVAAAAPDAVSGVAIYDTGLDSVMDEALAAQFGDVIRGVAERADDGRVEEAAEFLIEHSHLIYSEEDYHDEVSQRFWREAAPNIPVLMQQLAHAAEAPSGATSDPNTLARIQAPVLLMRGARSHPWFRRCIDYLVERLPNATVRDVDAAHFGPYLAPAEIARELSTFFSPILRPA
jgi:pimeloyl-ACP methyl ester carboxylesterase